MSEAAIAEIEAGIYGLQVRSFSIYYVLNCFVHLRYLQLCKDVDKNFVIIA